MEPIIETALAVMERWINEELERIHGEAIAKLKSMAKSTGQRTRLDRVRK